MDSFISYIWFDLCHFTFTHLNYLVGRNVNIADAGARFHCHGKDTAELAVDKFWWRNIIL